MLQNNKVFSINNLAIFSFLSFLMGSIFFSQPSSAQSQSEEFSKCEALNDASERLKCFERVLRSMKTSRAAPYRPTPVAPTKENESAPAPAATEAPRAGDKFDDFGKPAERRKVEEERMVSNVSRFSEDPNGKFTFYLDNGQVWKETDGSYLRIPRSTKDLGEVTIYKNAFGGYRIKVINNPKDGRVKRLK